jgi:hemerythrin superfamily protein
VVIPEVRKVAGKDGGSIEAITKRMEDEHKVLQMLGNGIRVAVAEGDKEIDRSKVMLYADTLESHNSSEETLLFPRWKEVTEKETQSAPKATQMIHDFGLERYLKVTCFSQEFLSQSD